MATPIPRNEAAFSLAEVLSLTGGTPRDCAATELRGVRTNSREAGEGTLFVALRGERFDGHAYVSQALASGAAAALVCRGSGQEGPRVEVDDTLLALASLARGHLTRLRSEGSVPVAAVGGAAGKTTTKELLAAAMRALYGETLATRGNLNNLVGVPMTLLTLGPQHRAAVLECGTNARGEVAQLGAMVQPDVALLLNVELEHTEGLGSLEGVAQEEGDLLRAARSVAVGNADDPMVMTQLASVRVAKRTFGRGASDARLVSREPTVQGRTRLAVELAASLCAEGIAQRAHFELRLLGPGPAIDAVAALLAALCTLGAPATLAQREAACAALGTVEAVPGRLRPLREGEVLVLDDTYNANPGSMRLSLEAARELADASRARLVLVLGEMLELGALSDEAHGEVLALAAASKPAAVLLVGEQFRALAAAHSLGYFAGAMDCADALREACAGPTVVLLKGSRGVGLERVMHALWPASRA